MRADSNRDQRHKVSANTHRILLEEWAYVRDWTSDAQRRAAYDGFIHFYNHHRSHGALGWATPMATLNRLLGDNVRAEHT